MIRKSRLDDATEVMISIVFVLLAGILLLAVAGALMFMTFFMAGELANTFAL